MQESREHRKYDKQFKEEAVRLVTEGGRQVTDTARSLGIHENLLHTWKRKLTERDRLYGKIGKLQIEVDWLKKRQDISANGGRETCNDRTGYAKLSIRSQCKLLDLPRASYYRHPTVETAEKSGKAWVSLICCL